MTILSLNNIELIYFFVYWLYIISCVVVILCRCDCKKWNLPIVTPFVLPTLFIHL